MRYIIQFVLITFFASISATVMATEEPRYTILQKEDAFELRRYAPVIIAEVMVDGNLDEASGKGFRLLAAYIFGDNHAADGSSKIAMTAPVGVAPRPQKIEMTAPVGFQADAGRWRVYFVMPSEYTLDSLPRPNNAAITIRALPERKVAALTFSGLAGENKTMAKTEVLHAYLNNKGWAAISTPELARYNPPWTLPFLRRNEILIEVNP
jgi:hypothetical protein